MKKIALLYSPKGGSVEHVSTVFKEICKEELSVLPIADFDVKKMNDYQSIILGCSTVGADSWGGASQTNDWEAFFHTIESENVSIKDKVFAIYGLGNQVMYPDHFVDAIIELKQQLEKQGAKVIGECSPEGYEDFSESRSFIDGKFVGLPIDEDNEPELTEERVKNWLDSIYKSL